MPDAVLLVLSIDTEEDNWYRSRQGVTCDNIGELHRQGQFFDRLGIRPTYFTSYQVARNARAAEVVREVGARGEIAAHLHPWNTPPLSEAFVPLNSMLKNLPPALQYEKLQALTTTLAETFGPEPRAFRAGRYGLGRDTVAALVRCGYKVDSSVTPGVSWETYDDGPTFNGAPLDVYRIAPNQNVTVPVEDGDIVEVPLSCELGSRGITLLLQRARRVSKPIVLSPETATAQDMLTLSRRLLERGVRHLHLTWHSPSLQPGLGPFTQTSADVDRLYGAVETYLERLSAITTLTPVTVSEAAAVEAAAC